MPTARALALAQSEGYDLDEIAPNAQPPVCKILDFGKYRYEEQQKQKDAKKKQRAVTWKEIRMAPKIDDHDIDTKVKAASRFLDEGDRLKVTVRFRGREMAHPDRGRTLLLAVGEKLKEHGIIERMPLLEGRQMTMVMNPVRRDAQAPGVKPATAAAPPAGTVRPGPMASPPPPANSPSPSASRPAPVVPAPQRPASAPPPSAAPRTSSASPPPTPARSKPAPARPAAAPSSTPVKPAATPRPAGRVD